MSVISWRGSAESMQSLQSSTGGDSSSVIEDGEGIILTLFPKYGFIRRNRNPQDNVYFHISVMEDIDESCSLTDFVNVGDKVQFSATISLRPNASAKWEATSVKMPSDSQKDDFMSASQFPDIINAANGVVYRTFPVFGFIRLEKPVRTEVYFHVSKVDPGIYITLEECNITTGTHVVCNACRAPEGHKAKYLATSVWFSEDTASIGVNQSVDPDLSLVQNVRGTVGSLHASYGFIRRNHNKEDNVYFHISVLEGFEPGETLENKLQVGQIVRFNARATTRPDASTRLQATTVWVEPDDVLEGNELYMSEESSSEEEESNPDELDEESSETDPEELDALSIGSDHQTDHNDVTTDNIEMSKNLQVQAVENIAKTAVTNYSNEAVCEGAEAISTTNALIADNCPLEKRQKLLSRKGNIYYLCDTLALIKFGENQEEEALAIVNVIYKRSIKCLNLELDIEEGESVTFNAVEDQHCPSHIKWKASLVWDRYTLQIPLSSDAGRSDAMWKSLHEEYNSTQYIRQCKLYAKLNACIDSIESNGTTSSRKKKKGGGTESGLFQIPSNVCHMPGLTGTITKVTKHYAEVVTKSLKKPVLIQFRNMYVNNKRILTEIRASCNDLPVTKGDALHFEYCEVSEKSGKKIEIIPIAWKDKKPKIADDVLSTLFKLCSTNFSTEDLNMSIISDPIIDKAKEVAPDNSLTFPKSLNESTSEKLPKIQCNLDNFKNSVTHSNFIGKSSSNAPVNHVTIKEKVSNIHSTPKTNVPSDSDDSEQFQDVTAAKAPIRSQALLGNFTNSAINREIPSEVLELSSDRSDSFKTASETCSDEGSAKKIPSEPSSVASLLNKSGGDAPTPLYPSRDIVPIEIKSIEGRLVTIPMPVESTSTKSSQSPVELSSDTIFLFTTSIVNSLKPSLSSLPNVVCSQLLKELSSVIPNICSRCQNSTLSSQSEATPFKCDTWTQTDRAYAIDRAVQASSEQLEAACQALPDVTSTLQQTLSTGDIHSQKIYHL